MTFNVRRTLMVSAGLVLVAVLGMGYYLWSIERQYDKARDQADLVRSRFDSEDGPPSLGTLPQLDDDLFQLEEDLQELDRRVDRPLIGGIARNAPFLGERVRSSQQLLDLGIELTGISRDTTKIANEIRDAFETNGFMNDAPAVGPTWLDVISARNEDIYELERRYDVALQHRAELNVDDLPDRALNTLATVDGLLERGTEIRDQYFHLFPLLDTAFGAQENAYYLILLQNGQELRQSGGFVGTYGMVTIANGRIAELEINPIGVLNQAYVDARRQVLPAPAPIQKYLGQEEWLPHDANWMVDFPEVAAGLSAMYADTGWPELQGIVAVNDSAVQAALEIIGPYEFEAEGELLTVTPDSFIDLIQSFRGQGELHKEVVADLGRSLIDQMLLADFDTKKDVFWAMRDSANQREIQVAMLEPAMQAEVSRRGWDGALLPDEDLATLAVTLSNVTGNKSSSKVWLDAHLDMTVDEESGTRHVTWSLVLSHFGDPGGNLDFNGFHRTWLQVYLPDGATLVDSSRVPEPASMTNDPRAVGYHIELLTGEQETLVIEFDLPVSEEALLLRRQSGLHNIDYFVNQDGNNGCSMENKVRLDHDYLVDFSTCQLSMRKGNDLVAVE